MPRCLRFDFRIEFQVGRAKPPRGLLIVNPVSGPSPLVVDLTLGVSRATAGLIRYQFDCAADGEFEFDLRTTAKPCTALGAWIFSGVSEVWSERRYVDLSLLQAKEVTQAA
jgi:hypothetical protein